MTLTQKETQYLNEFKSQEQLCIEKYTKYSQEACNPTLKNMFSALSQEEQKHLNTINGILEGKEPENQPAPSATDAVCNVCTPYTDQQSKQADKYLCQDMLAMEKHVSGGYNTGIFECSHPALRDTLAHIQKEEQNHGERLYSFMEANGMYS